MTYAGNRSLPVLPLVFLGLLSLIWGYNWVVMKIALASCPPLLFAALRVLGGALVLFPLLIFLDRPLKMPKWRYVLPLGLFQSTGFVGLTLWGLEFGGAGKTAVLVYMMPLWLILLSWPFLGERIHGKQWIALALSLMGLLLILDPLHLHGHLTGTVLALLSGFSWAFSAIWQKRHAPPGTDLLNATAWQMVFGGMVLAVIAVIVDPIHILWTPSFVGALLYNAIPGNALAWVLWAYVLHSLPPGIAGMGTLIAPLIGVFAAWGQLGERPGGWEAIGMTLIVLALLLVTWQHLSADQKMPIPSAQE
ncbi:MAG: DMT family transporter [Leptospirales bacterium]